MAFSINTNLTALKAYNALSSINAKTQKAQMRLATGKRINSVGDDTSGFNVGKALEAKSMVNKSKLNNADAALNYLSTAEASLQQLTDLFTQIQSKHLDSKDAAKDQASIASDIRSLASEIDSILKNTKFNDQNLLAQSDGSALATSPIFEVMGEINMDFAGSSYLNVDTLMSKVNGGPQTVVTSGVASYTGSYFNSADAFSGPAPLIEVYENGSATPFLYTNPAYDMTAGATTKGEAAQKVIDWVNGNSPNFVMQFHENGANSYIDLTMNASNLMDTFQSYGGFDIANLGFSFQNATTSSTVSAGGLTSSNDNDVMTAASDISDVIKNVKSALGRIGNLTQQVQKRSDFLTSAITNSTSSVSRLFDADMAFEQLNATKGSIASQAATQMLSQANTNPQQILQLFR